MTDLSTADNVIPYKISGDSGKEKGRHENVARRPVLKPDQQTAFNDALFTGVARKDIEMIKLALQNGADPNLLLFEGITYKKTMGDGWNGRDTVAMRLEWMRTAVNAGADVNTTRDYEQKPWAAVHWLHDRFNDRLMSYLLDNGVKVDTPDPKGNTLLQRAVDDGKAALVEYYLSKGADPMQACGEKQDTFPLQTLQRSDKFKKDVKAKLLMLMMKKVKPPPQPAPVVVAPKPEPKPKSAPPQEEAPRMIPAPEPATFIKRDDPEPEPMPKHIRKSFAI